MNETIATLILHDLRPDVAADVLPPASAHCRIFAASPPVHRCVGCFGCWIKTPGRCVIGDRGSEFAALLSRCGEFVVLSRMVFGGLSPDAKAVLDRSIGFLLPFFRSVNGETHHAHRVENPPDLRYVLYGNDITDTEKETAKKLVAANSLNLGSGRSSVEFYQSARGCAEAFA
ncbi:MAG: flavodoxin family protein [Clostridiales Family XIII bacterium]|nr:flavodoxin family protein [Clostridiales Family XIII bacterium]